jgi:hypothetical protein
MEAGPNAYGIVVARFETAFAECHQGCVEEVSLGVGEYVRVTAEERLQEGGAATREADEEDEPGSEVGSSLSHLIHGPKQDYFSCHRASW